MDKTQPNWERVAYLALLSRKLDELEIQQLTPQGLVKYQFSAQGHELCQILLAQALDHPHDAAGIYYRSRPFVLACGLTADQALAANMARLGGPSSGRDAGVIYNLPGGDSPTVLPASGNVGAQYTPAAGWAQAIHYRERVLADPEWSKAIAVAMGGDGSVAANGFWAALNIVTTQNLPYLYFIEDNGYGLSVPNKYQTPGGDISANLSAYGNLEILRGDGTNPQETWDCVYRAVQHVRSGAGPAMLHLRVPRLTGHTFVDDQAYKSPEQIQAEAANDPLPKLQAYYQAQANPGATWDELVGQVEIDLQEALEWALAQPEPEPEQVGAHVFFCGTPPLQGGLRAEGAHIPVGDSQPEPSGPRLNLIDAARRTLESEMARNPRLLVFGEDVGLKGGVHGATRDMQLHWGAERVFDTSLSEDGIIGRAAGMAMAGLLPVPEIQFRKYADPAHEQISDLGTIRWRTANRFAAPVVVRMPVGYGKQTGDPWHSLSGEAIYAHLPGWRLAYPSNAEDLVGLLRTALRGDDPSMIFEHRALLDTAPGRTPYPGDDYCLPFGRAAIRQTGDELCVITWGAMVTRCLAAAQPYSGRVTVIDLRTIIPWDRERVLDAVHQTGKVLVVHEDTYTAGFASEICATISEYAFTDLDAPIARLATPDVPIAYNAGLMDASIPSVAVIQQRIDDLLAY